MPTVSPFDHFHYVYHFRLPRLIKSIHHELLYTLLLCVGCFEGWGSPRLWAESDRGPWDESGASPTVVAVR